MSLPALWVRPSMVRGYIRTLYASGTPPPPPNPGSTWDHGHYAPLAGLLDLVEQMDARLVSESVPEEELINWSIAVAAIRATLERWRSGTVSFALHRVGAMTADPVLTLYRTLEKCPDELAPRALASLRFVKNAALRTSLARDIDSLDALHLAGQWKAVTVIGGSAVEALLLDALMRPKYRHKAKAEEARHIAAGTKAWKPPQPIEQWHLWKLIVVAEALAIIAPAVASVCTGARQFRNLIHPGKERLGYPCDRGTALAVRGAVEQVVRSLGGTLP